MIFLQNGCQINKEEKIRYCNFLLEIKLDTSSETDIRTKAEENFLNLGCTVEDACDYCYTKPQPGPPSPGPAAAPVCENTRPAACPAITLQISQQGAQQQVQQRVGEIIDTDKTNETTQPSQQDQQETFKRIRRKRKLQKVDKVTKVDFDTEAIFIKLMMEIPAQYR